MKIRPLKLKYEPTADNDPLFARDVVASTARVTGDVLDYSVESLTVVDRILEKQAISGAHGVPSSSWPADACVRVPRRAARARLPSRRHRLVFPIVGTEGGPRHEHEQRHQG